MSSKRKRSANYTHQEAENLLELVNKYRSIIDDKRISSAFNAQKKEAWEKICSAYNTIATTGPRTADQLKALYENKKQLAKKALADKKLKPQHDISVEDIQKFLVQEREEKGKDKSGLVNWISPDSNNCLKIVEISSLSNDCGDPDAVFAEDRVASPEQMSMTWPLGLDKVKCEQNNSETEGCDNSVPPTPQKDPLTSPTPIPPPWPTFDIGELRCNYKNKEDSHSEGSPTDKSDKPPIAVRQKVQKLTRPKKKKLSSVDFKKLYFKRKYQNAVLECRKLRQEIRFRQQQYSLFLREHMLKMQLLRKKCDSISDNMLN